MVLNIVTLHAGGKVTINLKGPILINCRTWMGKQVVLSDAGTYSLQHPIVTAES
jgi:flagellar assembly factor FliW